MTKLSLEHANSVTGLIPAAGRGTRLPGLTGSKELLPVPDPDGPGHVAAIRYSLQFLLDCGISRHHVAIAPTKTDIREFLRTDKPPGSRLSFTEIANSPSVPHSLDAAYDSIAADNIVLVFPDIMFEPRAEIASVLAAFSPKDFDVLLPVVPSVRGDKVDLVSIDQSGLVNSIAPKPGRGKAGWTWVTAAWTPVFTEFLHQFLRETTLVSLRPAGQELYVGDVMNAAIDAGLSIRAHKIESGASTDIGTPDEYAELWRRSGREPPERARAALRGKR